MSHSIDGSETASTEAGVGTKLSRRRPGRIDNVNPSLIPLLRGTVSPDIEDPVAGIPEVPATMDVDEDAMAPVRGIIFGIALSVPIWAVLIFGALHLFSGVVLEIALSIPIWAALSIAACHLLD
jgi:hypothetical protein